MMKRSVLILSLAALVGGAAPALAGDASSPAAAAAIAVRPGAYLRSADGRRIGVIEDVATGRDGAPIDAQVILDSRIVHIPASTLKASDKDHFTTSLSYKQVKAL